MIVHGTPSIRAKLVYMDCLLCESPVSSRARTSERAKLVSLDETRAEMKRILADIQSGRFASKWVAECNAGQPSFKALRRQWAEHPAEEVGAKLRAMMPWLAEGKLVDKTKN